MGVSISFNRILYNTYWFFIFLLIYLMGIPGFFVYDSLSAIGPYLISDAGFTQVDISWMYTAFYGPNVVFSLFFGLIIDKFGERKMTLVFSFVTTAGQAIVCFFPKIAPMLIGRVLIGASAEGLFVCQLKILFCLFPNNAGFVLSVFIMMNRLASMMAYLILPIFAKSKGWVFTLYFCGALCLFSLFVNVFFLFFEKVSQKSSLLKNEEEKVRRERSENEKLNKISNKNQEENANSDIEVDPLIKKNEDNEIIEEEGDAVNKQGLAAGLKICLTSLPFISILVINFFFYGCFLSFSALSPVFVANYYNVSANEASFIVSFLSFGSMISAPLSGYLADQYGVRMVIMVVGLLCGIIPFAIMSVTNQVNIFVLIMILGVSYGVTPISMYSLVPLSLQKQFYGIGNALMEWCVGAAVLLFPFVFGYLSDKSSATIGLSVFSFLLTICFIIAVFLFFYSQIKMGGLYEKGKKKKCC